MGKVGMSASHSTDTTSEKEITRTFNIAEPSQIVQEYFSCRCTGPLHGALIPFGSLKVEWKGPLKKEPYIAKAMSMPECKANCKDLAFPALALYDSRFEGIKDEHDCIQACDAYFQADCLAKPDHPTCKAEVCRDQRIDIGKNSKGGTKSVTTPRYFQTLVCDEKVDKHNWVNTHHDRPHRFNVSVDSTGDDFAVNVYRTDRNLPKQSWGISLAIMCQACAKMRVNKFLDLVKEGDYVEYTSTKLRGRAVAMGVTEINKQTGDIYFSVKGQSGRRSSDHHLNNPRDIASKLRRLEDEDGKAKEYNRDKLEADGFIPKGGFVGMGQTMSPPLEPGVMPRGVTRMAGLF